MSQKQVYIDGIGEVTLARRRGTRALRLSINASGRVRVGLPHWVPYKTAIRFAEQRRDWIAKHQVLNQHPPLKNGTKVGKAHRLHFFKDIGLKSIRTNIDATNIYVRSPYDIRNEQIQLRTRRACEKALHQEADNLLPQRVNQLARKYGFTYKDIKIKKLTSRWGSCSNSKVITLSYYLMQLPWELIDYVIIHELVHTDHLHHGVKFWQEMENIKPGAKKMQKMIRTHKPRVEPWGDLI